MSAPSLGHAVRQVTGQAGGCQMAGVRRMQMPNIGGSCASAVRFVVKTRAL